MQKRELRERKEQLESKVVTIFYAEGQGNTEQLAHHIGAHLEYEGVPVVNLGDIEKTTFMKYRVSFRFLITLLQSLHFFEGKLLIFFNGLLMELRMPDIRPLHAEKK